MSTQPSTKNTPALTFTHPDYGLTWHEWQTIQDVCAGTTEIKRKATVYLPKLTDQTDDEYQAMKIRAVFFNATKRTKDALSGLLMRKQPVLTLPGGETESQPLLADINMAGASVFQWIRGLSDSMVSTGRKVTVIDYNQENQRPYMVTYEALDVLNWATGIVDGRRILTLLIVRETEEILDGFRVDKRDRYRSYRIVDGQVLYRTWQDGDTAGYEAGEDKPMLRRGKPLTRIPAVFHNASHLGPEIGEAPLYDVAEINLSHYRTSCDLENGRHIAGLPTPWATGVDDSNQALTLGTTKMMTCEKEGAKFGFLEFTGQGLDALTKALEEKERQMAILGARLLFDAKKDAESFDTVKLRAASETAALGNIAGHLTVTITEALQWFYWWQGTEQDHTGIGASCLMNQDFVDTTMDSATLQALVAAFQQNALSFDAFFHKLKEGEIYPDGWDVEREAAAIGQRPPATMPLPPAAPPGGEGPPGKPGASKPGEKAPAKAPAKGGTGKEDDKPTPNKA